MIDNKMYLQRNGDEVELHQISQTRRTNAQILNNLTALYQDFDFQQFTLT